MSEHTDEYHEEHGFSGVSATVKGMVTQDGGVVGETDGDEDGDDLFADGQTVRIVRSAAPVWVRRYKGSFIAHDAGGEGETFGLTKTAVEGLLAIHECEIDASVTTFTPETFRRATDE